MTHHDLNCAHGVVSISIAFLAADPRADAVQVDLSVSFLPTDERLEWAVHGEWVADRDLAAFEAQLASSSAAELRTVRGRVLMRVVEAAGHALIEMGPASAPADGAAEACFVRLSTPPGLKDAIGRAFSDYAKWW